jgi:chemotaxis protein methyltransferase WspC
VHGRIAALLKDKIGLDVDSIGVGSIERAVRDRLTMTGVRDEEAYIEHVSASEMELRELIEAVVVPETWFYRDREAFAALARVATERRSRNSVLRILSLPCSTGEEPYSIAMTLLDAGVQADHFQIDAVDISARAIAHAQRGIYGKNSFRGHALDFRDRYFESTAEGYRLSNRARDCVRFRQGNFFDMDRSPLTAAYDVIFCRNVLIYFDRPEQDRAVQILSRLLDREGVLFVGPSEAGLFLEHGFPSARIPLAFAFRRTGTTPDERAARCRPARKTLPPLLLPRPSAPKPMPALPASPCLIPGKASQQAPPGEPWLEEAQRLADEGDVIGALEYCERHMNAARPSAQAFYLMGLLHDAAGRAQRAGDYYRKALYLEPAHREALVHLAMLLQGTGDIRGAQLLFDRAERISAAGNT